ncbi:hypothetical protein NC796_15920 [Aliifodinibius sp. S!AR15-10]|uniref:hypothetical protein n=1 Tax=Aliifodinibius sp. S!AR15-10 TaxID=2950437 RepID=UPI002860D7FB|nr:hypothetical protein [Aliifodinibius sp. S!AR15-10]MDR8392643.1 hypothetical protein [Aliifodinibius sp. S!AR15-10]
MVLLTKAVARRWPNVYANAVDPSWVPTNMGGSGAPDDLQKGYQTQVWLAVNDEGNDNVSGRNFHHKKEADYHPQANNPAVQDKFLSLCEQVTGVCFPVNKK